MQSNESLMSEEVQCFSEYAEDIHRHLRKSEVRNDLNFEHLIMSLTSLCPDTIECIVVNRKYFIVTGFCF